ncbi:MAG: drug/metabolite exporter YedA [Myxococcales bacterium]|nr:drug/metabolite exporter YedA [Myxococcales bacterium]
MRGPLAIAAALLALYTIWGSTYLAIAVAVRDGGFETFQLNATRFVTAGLIMLAVARFRGVPFGTARAWRNAALVGVLLVIGGNGLTTVALRWGAPSGLSATVIATTPLWAGIWSAVFGHRPARLEWLGMGVGVLGVAVLTLDARFRAQPAIFLQFVAPILWALGSMWSKRVEMPSGLVASGVQMVAGGLVALPLSLALGETWSLPNTQAWSLWFYLVLFGSLVGYNAYLFLLSRVSPALATSYAFVNPLVALALGAWLANEALDVRTFVALPMVLFGVGVIGFVQRREARAARALA